MSAPTDIDTFSDSAATGCGHHGCGAARNAAAIVADAIDLDANEVDPEPIDDGWWKFSATRP